MRSLPKTLGIVAVRDLGHLEQAHVILGRDGGYSARVGDRSIWVFGDTALRFPGVSGSTWLSNSLAWTLDLNAGDSITDFENLSDSLDVPVEFLPWTEEEIVYNAQHDSLADVWNPGARYALWPSAVAWDEERNRTLYFYAKMYVGGVWDFYAIGHSIAVGAPDQGIIRPELRPGSPEPTLMFDAAEPDFGTAATVSDGMLYVYGCHARIGFKKPIHLARVPIPEALDRTAWRYYAGNGAWSSNIEEALMLFDGCDIMSVYYNQYLGQYLAIYSEPLTNWILMRTAPAFEGPWSAETRMFEGMAPADTTTWNYCGMAHREFQRESGRFEYITYYRNAGFWKGELRPVEVEFELRRD